MDYLLINNILEIKELIDKTIKIEQKLKSINEELLIKDPSLNLSSNNNNIHYGGKNNLNRNDKLELYKKIIIKLKKKKNHHLNLIDNLKNQILNLTNQLNINNIQLNKCAQINFTVGTENSNLIDKLEFFNKSLDILLNSINTNINDTSRALDIAQTKEYVKNININIQPSITSNEVPNKLSNEPGELEIKINENNLSGSTNDIVSVNTQHGGEVSKIKNINSKLLDKLRATSYYITNIKNLIQKINDYIGTRGDPMSLINIKLKYEWLLNELKKNSSSSSQNEQLIQQLENINADFDMNLFNLSGIHNEIQNINTGFSAFNNNMTTIENTASNTIPDYQNSLQTGGNNILIGGMDWHMIKNWFVTLKIVDDQWDELGKLKLFNIKLKYDRILDLCKNIFDTYNGLDDFNPFKEFTNICDFTSKILDKYNNDYDALLRDQYLKIMGDEDQLENIFRNTMVSIFNPINFLMLFFIKAVKYPYDIDDLDKYEIYLFNISTNLNELLNLYNILQYICKKEVIISRDEEEKKNYDENFIIKIESSFLELKEFAITKNLIKDPVEYNKFKRKLVYNNLFVYNFKDKFDILIKCDIIYSDQLYKNIEDIILKYEKLTLGINNFNSYNYTRNDKDKNYITRQSDKFKEEIEKIFQEFIDFRNLYIFNKTNDVTFQYLIKFNNLTRYLYDIGINYTKKITENEIRELLDYLNKYEYNESLDKYFKSIDTDLTNSNTSMIQTLSDKIKNKINNILVKNYEKNKIETDLIKYTRNIEYESTKKLLKSISDMNQLFNYLYENDKEFKLTDIIFLNSNLNFKERFIDLYEAFIMERNTDDNGDYDDTKFELDILFADILDLIEENSDLNNIIDKSEQINIFIIKFNEINEKLYKNNKILEYIKKLSFIFKKSKKNNEIKLNIVNKWETNKRDQKKLVREIQNIIERDSDVITYNDKNNSNIFLLNYLEKIMIESLNSIKVYVKARQENSENISNYQFEKNCITVNGTRYGKFENIFNTEATFSDLYCGTNVKCERKIPLTDSVRDLISTDFKSNIFFTYGFSGSGKTTLLYGLPGGTNEQNKRGIIGHILQDNLDKIMDDKIDIKFMIGEIYGEKTSLSINDNNYVECIYLWDNIKFKNSNNKIDEIEEFDYTLYTHDYNSTGSNQSVIENIDALKNLKQNFITENIDWNDNYNINNFNKMKFFRLTNNIDNIQKTSDIFNVINPDNNYEEENFKLLDKDSIKKDLFSLLTEDDNYKYKETIYNNNNKSTQCEILSKNIDEIIRKIQIKRRKENRVRSTKFNPDSSRSHMFFILKFNVNFEDKYYIFLDKAGNEIPYEIATEEFTRLTKDIDDKQKIFKINFDTNLDSNFYFVNSENVNLSPSDVDNPGDYDKILEEKSNRERNKGKRELKNKILNIIKLQTDADHLFNKSFINFDSNSKIDLAGDSITYKFLIKIEDDDISYIKKENLGDKVEDEFMIKLNKFKIALELNISSSNTKIGQNFDFNIDNDISGNYLIQENIINYKNLLDFNIILSDNSIKLLKEDVNKLGDIIELLKKIYVKENIKKLFFKEEYKPNVNNIINGKYELNDSNGTIINYNSISKIKYDNFKEYINSENSSSVFDCKLSINFLNIENDNLFRNDEYDSYYLMMSDKYNVVNMKLYLLNKSAFKKIDNELVGVCKNIYFYDYFLGYIDNDKKIDIDKSFKVLYDYYNLFVPLLQESSMTVSLEKKQKFTKLFNDINKFLVSVPNIEEDENLYPYHVDSFRNTYLVFLSIIEMSSLDTEDDAEIFYNYILNSFELLKKIKHADEINNKPENLIKSKRKKILRINTYSPSTIDKTIPELSEMNIDYRKLLSQYYIQRNYLYKHESNDQALLRIINEISCDLEFLFDDKNNFITNNLIIQNFKNIEPVTSASLATSTGGSHLYIGGDTNDIKCKNKPNDIQCEKKKPNDIKCKEKKIRQQDKIENKIINNDEECKKKENKNNIDEENKENEELRNQNELLLLKKENDDKCKSKEKLSNLTETQIIYMQIDDLNEETCKQAEILNKKNNDYKNILDSKISLEEEVNTINLQITNSKEEQIQKKKFIADLQKELENSNNKEKELAEKKTQLEEKKTQLEEKLVHEIKIIEDEKKQLETENTQKKQEEQKIQREISLQEEKITLIEANKNKEELNSQRLELELQGIDNIILEYNSKFKQQNIDIKQKKKEIQRMNTNIASKDLIRNQKNEIVTIINQNILKKTDELKIKKKKLENTKKELENNIRNITLKNPNLTIAEQKESIDKLDAEKKRKIADETYSWNGQAHITNLNNKATEAERKAIESNTRLNLLKLELSTLSANKESNEQEIQTLNGEIPVLESTIVNLTDNDKPKATRIYSEIDLEIKNLEIEQRELNNQVESLEEELTEITKNLEENKLLKTQKMQEKNIKDQSISEIERKLLEEKSKLNNIRSSATSIEISQTSDNLNINTSNSNINISENNSNDETCRKRKEKQQEQNKSNQNLSLRIPKSIIKDESQSSDRPETPTENNDGNGLIGVQIGGETIEDIEKQLDALNAEIQLIETQIEAIIQFKAGKELQIQSIEVEIENEKSQVAINLKLVREKKTAVKRINNEIKSIEKNIQILKEEKKVIEEKKTYYQNTLNWGPYDEIKYKDLFELKIQDNLSFAEKIKKVKKFLDENTYDKTKINREYTMKKTTETIMIKKNYLNENIKDFINFLKRLFIISQIDNCFEFLNIFIRDIKLEYNIQESERDNVYIGKKIISIFDKNSIINNFKKIFMSDYDEITYNSEFEEQFNITESENFSFENNSNYISTLWKSSYIDENKNIWEMTANKLLPMYLLNVRQGFWINHSIRQLMRTIMYSTDEKWSEYDIFDTDKLDTEIDLIEVNFITKTSTEKEYAIKELRKSIQLLNFKNKNDVEKTELSVKILKKEETLETYYLSKYNIKESSWIKLLISFFHLGLNKNPLQLASSGGPFTESELDIDFTKNIDNLVIDVNNQASTNKLSISTHISKCVTLLLALSTRADKVDGVMKTLEFAQLLSLITNPKCPEIVPIQQTQIIGGNNIKKNKNKKYKIVNENYKYSA